LLRYQGLAVENYGSAPECLANERIRRVKNPGYPAVRPDITLKFTYTRASECLRNFLGRNAFKAEDLSGIDPFSIEFRVSIVLKSI
jgi:hypothetical protein